MSRLKYAPALAMAAVVIVLLGVVKYKEYQADALRTDIHRLETKLILSEQSLAAAGETITHQNEKIASHAVNMEEAEKRYNMELAALHNKSNQARVETVRELVRDPSCENELFLIRKQLDAFYE